MSFSRLEYPGNGDSPIEFQPTGINRYKVLDKRTQRVLGLVERVQLRGFKTPRWAIVGRNGLPGSATHPTRTVATVELYRQVTGKSLSYRGPSK